MSRKQRTLRFEMPFAMVEPSLVHPEVGIERAVRRGPKHTWQRDITLLDSSDHRLLRSGIVLAHRVTDGLGEWYLDAPTWAPWLPTDKAQPMGGGGDLPDEFATLVRPFRRHAALGPVAAVTRQRKEWLLVAQDGEQLGRVRDDQWTIRRGGVVVGRQRDVSLSPDELMTREQRNLLVESLLAMGGTRVDEFPSLVERIGAPATGLSDFRSPGRRDERDTTLEGFVSWLFARRLDAVMRADLALRSGRSTDMDLLRAELAELKTGLRSLAFALEPHWRETVESEVDVVLAQLASHTIHQLGDEYFDVLDQLVLGGRAPRLGDLSHHQALESLWQQATAGATILFDRAHSLTMTSPDDRWAATLASAKQMMALAHTNRLVFGKRAKRVEARLDEVVGQLQLAQMPPSVAEPSIDLEWDAVTAFQEGRRFERRRQECQSARRSFIDQWPENEAQLRKVIEKGPSRKSDGKKDKGARAMARKGLDLVREKQR